MVAIGLRKWWLWVCGIGGGGFMLVVDVDLLWV